MAISGGGSSIKVRVRGVTSSIRMMANANTATHIAAVAGVEDAAEHLKTKIEGKFGKYQKTGGYHNGPWKSLNVDYRFWKKSKGLDHGPLILRGKMKGSFYIKKGGKGTIAASVGSDDPKIKWHVFGAPRANIPPRDMILVTAVEESDKCHAIIKDHVYRAWSKASIGKG